MSRRELLRARTIEEIQQHGFALVDAGGVSAVTIAALGKAMEMTPPSLYRYYPSRDAVVEALVAAAYADLGAAVESAAAGNDTPSSDAAGSAIRGGDSPADRLDRLVHEYRRWALVHPRRYTMLFADRAPGTPDPADGVTAVNRGMRALITTLAEITGPEPADDDLQRWSEGLGLPGDVSPRAVRLAVQLWYRVHGLISLELTGAFASMGLDAGHLLSREIRTALDDLG
ncbi:TetR/AcrR family transcriptional regulator [Actinoplanes couchii]|uniref:TetR family transcriptional regulator n=1 Tax=Actinoplanes couchii TaxID=403638 RepID=A0ABQ3XQV7_9ACTN|nr:TetR/AcrR family transcriptional regulator [Actinoplanes couchii]MDR6317365.1 AcrR family transcriptional regulator [Actinoplanes couchii]GID60899.1 TetR family transcriptional regulator [Actinoplanes couchii]